MITTIKKRNNTSVSYDEAKIYTTLERIMHQHNRENNTDYITRLIHEINKNIFNNISTAELEQAMILSATALIKYDPVYDHIAKGLVLQHMYKQIFKQSSHETTLDTHYRHAFIDNIHTAINEKLLNPAIQELFSIDILANELVIENDWKFQYLGIYTIYNRYCLRINNQLLETPQAFFMRVAMGLALQEKSENRHEKVIEFYRVFTEHRFLSSTPTLFHSGLLRPQLSSCYVSIINDDLHHIFKVLGDNAQLAKWNGGIGNDWSYIRATGAHIKSTQIESQGIIPFLKIANDTTLAINRSGKRRGATCAYLEVWHMDIEDFLDLRRNTGDDRRRTHDMDTACWVPDLFMKRVEEKGQWTLFSPDETPDLHDLYGSAFERQYEQYEVCAHNGTIRLWKTIDAITLWRKMLTRLFETGHPWITWKDACNTRNPQNHVGVIHSSNLCTEIALNNSAEETAVCNLGSLNLKAHVIQETGEINYALLQDTIKTAIRMLDNVIDINFYPTKEAQFASTHHRPIGLGVMGTHDMLLLKKLSFDSAETADIIDTLMEYISYHAIESSCALAQERGSYKSFTGSKWHRGIFPLDTIALYEQERGVPILVDRTSRLEWNSLKDKVKQFGLRNSHMLAIAPTATIANILGVIPCIEPIYKNMYVKANMAGEFTIVNQYLIQDLKKYNLWNDEMAKKLILHEGSITNIDEIPHDIKALYREIFDYDAQTLIDLTALRGKWIDQSQSHNIFINGVAGKKLHQAYMYAWHKGLKTTYYLRSIGASSIEKSSVGVGGYNNQKLN